MRSAMEVFLTLTHSAPPSSPPPALAARPARALLKAKKSPNFFFIFLEGFVVVVVVLTQVKMVLVEVAQGGGTSGGRHDKSDTTQGGVTAVMVEGTTMSDEEGKEVVIERVEPDSEGVAWTGFDSSHQLFLQQGDSRKSNRQKEIFSTTTTGSKPKSHAPFWYTKGNSCKQHTE